MILADGERMLRVLGPICGGNGKDVAWKCSCKVKKCAGVMCRDIKNDSVYLEVTLALQPSRDRLVL